MAPLRNEPARPIASFRLYGQLNDFISPGRRGCRFDYAFAESATVKHAVEALGVPHTEVDVILRNEQPVEFTYRLTPGDRLAIYPGFETLDLGRIPFLRPPLTGTRHFVADAHLGGLARLLRLAGFNTLYDNNFQDGRIEAIAMEEHRIVLSRDRELLKRSGVIHGAYVYSLQPIQQLVEVMRRYRLASEARPFSLCLSCNLPLRAVDKEQVLARLPPQIRASQHAFSICDACQGVFWKGSHWRRMDSMLSDAIRSANAASAIP